MWQDEELVTSQVAWSKNEWMDRLMRISTEYNRCNNDNDENKTNNWSWLKTLYSSLHKPT